MADPRVAQVVADKLAQQTEFRDAGLLLYCVMPDHVYAVIQIGSVDLTSVVRSFKAYVSPRCKAEGLETEFWHSRFHDRGVREYENLDKLNKYILGKAVDEGLASRWERRPPIFGYSSPPVLSRA
jgi:REP element-mobilizing transposase RayT